MMLMIWLGNISGGETDRLGSGITTVARRLDVDVGIGVGVGVDVGVIAAWVPPDVGMGCGKEVGRALGIGRGVAGGGGSL
jgi:hypothetical protein